MKNTGRDKIKKKKKEKNEDFLDSTPKIEAEEQLIAYFSK